MKGKYRGGLAHRRDRLKNHFETYHPTHSVQEWDYSDGLNQPKQRKLDSVFFVKPKNSESFNPESQIEDEEINNSGSNSIQNENLQTSSDDAESLTDERNDPSKKNRKYS